jgi:pimeloyl-ACP methyl ester carboxylesterase
MLPLVLFICDPYLQIMQRPVLLLHGAIGASDQLDALGAKLSATYDVHTFDFPGHGGTPMPAAPFSIPSFAAALLNFMQEKGLQEVDIFGYSMGGYVALYLAKYHPTIVNRIITLGTKLHWDEPTAAKEVKMLHPETILQKVPAFAAALERRHQPNDWKEVLHRTASMMLDLGRDNILKEDDFQAINKSILLLLGDRDQMVSFDETVKAYRALPQAQLGILPEVQHPIEKVDLALLEFHIRRFFGQ